MVMVDAAVVMVGVGGFFLVEVLEENENRKEGEGMVFNGKK